MSEQDWLAYLSDRGGRVSTIAIFLVGTYRFVVKPLALWLYGASQVLAKLDEIIAQFNNNGGSSLRDAIDRVEMRLLMNEQRHKALLLETPNGVWEADEQGARTWVNRTCCQILRRTSEELLGLGWQDFVAQDDLERVRTEWNNAVNNRKAFHCHFKYTLPDNSTIKVFVKAHPLIDNKGVLRGWIGTTVQEQ